MALIVDTPGARRLDYDQLKTIPAPQGTAFENCLMATDCPRSGRRLSLRSRLLLKMTRAFFNPLSAKMDLAVARGDDRFFGTFDLKTHVTDETTLTVGVRNSIP